MDSSKSELSKLNFSELVRSKGDRGGFSNEYSWWTMKVRSTKTEKGYRKEKILTTKKCIGKMTRDGKMVWECARCC